MYYIAISFLITYKPQSGDDLVVHLNELNYVQRIQSYKVVTNFFETVDWQRFPDHLLLSGND
jgi:hypothetical protein